VPRKGSLPSGIKTHKFFSMRLDEIEESQNVEDRRAEGGGRRGGGMVLGGGIGTLILVVIVMFLGGNPKQLLDMAGQQQAPQQEQSEYQGSPQDEEMVSFVKKVLSTTEEVWDEEFRTLGRTYEKPRLVLFSNGVRSGCGFADAQVGPFYCPADKTVYVDLSFFRELSQRFGAPGDFAQAYVIAHEVGHHVQKLLGTSDQVHQAQSQVSEVEKNELSVRLELQADFLAGVWARKAHEKFHFLESGDLEEAMNAANSIGDDTLQKQAQGRVVPDSFTHGTSQQRMKWFRKGVETGDVRQGDTFRVRDL
jgi:uncharacterized protein